jgi:hypothetical protein
VPLPQVPLNTAPLVASSADLVAVRHPATTTTANPGGGFTFPTSTITVVATGLTGQAEAGFSDPSQTLLVQTGASYTLCTYTGKTATTFTGVSGGSGVVLPGAGVVQAWQNTQPLRILAIFSLMLQTTVAGDFARAVAVSQIGGVFTTLGQASLSSIGTVNGAVVQQMVVPVDPGGWYGVQCITVGTFAHAEILVQSTWFEIPY